jgi:hypothetical protein
LEDPHWTPLLATIDVEIAYDRDIRAQEKALWRLSSDFRSFPSTWFCTADAAERFAAPLRALSAAGHTIACHGRDHGTWEDYRILPYATIVKTLDEATSRIEAAIGVRPRMFRGPRMTTSESTQAALRQLGYIADFSPCSRRWDFLTASCFSWQWPSTPNSPYRPTSYNAFRRAGPPGADDLVAVPLSGLVLPLCSGTLYLMGEAVTRRLAAALNQHNGSPLVYLFHSYEFCGISHSTDDRPLHHRLFPQDADTRYRSNWKFLTGLQASGATPLAASAFIESLGYGKSL